MTVTTTPGPRSKKTPARGPKRPAARPQRRTRELLLILDFGSQYTQLIARRVRELGVYSVTELDGEPETTTFKLPEELTPGHTTTV